MRIQLLSNPTLIGLHANIGHALYVDDNTPTGRDRVYGVRTYRDWAIQRDQFEAEMTRREIPFMPIVW